MTSPTMPGSDQESVAPEQEGRELTRRAYSVQWWYLIWAPAMVFLYLAGAFQGLAGASWTAFLLALAGIFPLPNWVGARRAMRARAQGASGATRALVWNMVAGAALAVWIFVWLGSVTW